MSGHDLIVVGASAGGVEALAELVALLPADLPAAVCVVVHIPATNVSMLPKILSRAGVLAAINPREGEQIQPGLIYIDLHLVHEVTSPQAFAVLRERGLRVRRPELTLATMDHSTPTATAQVFGGAPIAVDAAARQVRELEENCRHFGVELFGLTHGQRGIVHVIGPELGLT